jgi:hypothetical protein
MAYVAGSTMTDLEMLMATTIPDMVLQAAASRLSADDSNWVAGDVTASFPWLKIGRLFWIREWGGGSAMVYEGPGSDVTCLNAAEGVSQISELLFGGGSAVPSPANSPEEFAQLLVTLRGDPRKQVLGPNFLADQGDLTDWAGTAAVASLREFSRPPEYTRDSNGAFRLKFNVITASGAVETWTVTGKEAPFTLDPITVDSLMPEGSFTNPLEF